MRIGWNMADDRRRRRRRVALTGLAANTLINLGVAGWLLTTGLDARDDLSAARTAVARFRTDLLADRVQQAGADLSAVQRWTAAARDDTSGPAWAMAGWLPFVGRSTRTAQGLASAADALARTVMPGLSATAQAVRPAAPAAPGTVADLGALSAATPALDRAAEHLAGIETRLDALPGHTGSARLDQARAEMIDQTRRLAGMLHTADTAAHLLPAMLGAGGERRYFVALQNNAEARGTGGLVGAFAVLAADHGRVRFERFGADDAVRAAPGPVVEFGPDFDHRYAAAQSTQLLSNSNLSAHFPFAAEIWSKLWQQQTGQRVDGAVAIDPVGLARLLTATGPVTLPDGRRLTGTNAVAFTERDIYTAYPDTGARKQVLVRIAASIADTLERQRLGTPAVLRALAAAVSDDRLHLWSSRPREEEQLARTPLGGVVPETSGPFAELVVNNAAASKLDFYLRRRLDYRLGQCLGGNRLSTVRVQLTNTAPPTGLPDYVVNRSDDPLDAHVRGSDAVWASLYATQGALLADASLDGQPLLMSVDQERNHPVLSALVELLPGQTRTLTLHLLEPPRDGAPLTPVQPLALPQATVVSTAACTGGGAVRPGHLSFPG